jgi:hypothetical protein
MSTNEKRPGKRLIFVNRITTKTGKVLYAWQYGKKAFAIWVNENSSS